MVARSASGVGAESEVSLCILGQRTQISRVSPPQGEMGIRTAGVLTEIWFRTRGMLVRALLHRPMKCAVSSVC